MTSPVLLGRLDVDAATLWREHPPGIRDPKKLAIFELAGGASRSPQGQLAVTRWAPGAVGPLGALPSLSSVAGPFAYPVPDAGSDLWHVNFADPDVFAFYAGPMFAQDEIQVAEHPILASVRGRMLADPSMPALTWADGRATPVLVRGVERWCAIDTNPELARPEGIYGQRLRRASPEVLLQAVRRLDATPPSNILAISAPRGIGRYSKDDIREVLVTATTGFAAALLESARVSSGARVRIHTGHWGTGAFGGDRVLMAAAQILAARFTGVPAIAYHSLEDAGVRAFDKGAAIAEGFASGLSLDEVVTVLFDKTFYWGTSDGN